MKQFSFVLFIFLVSLGYGREIVIRPTANVSGFDQWGQVGSGTKIQKITDATDGNFIATTIVGDTDLFELTDVSLDNGEYADSMVLFVKAGSGFPEQATLQNNLMIGSDRAVGSTLPLAAGFIDYSITFAMPFGVRDGLDDAQVDSLRLEQFLSFVSADSGKITSDSIVVYTSYYSAIAGGSKAAGFATFYAVNTGTQIQHFSASIGTTAIPIDTPNFEIPAAALEADTAYVIGYGMSIGGRLATADPEVVVLYGSDTLSHIIYESDAATNPRSGGGCQIQGYAFLAANGADSIICRIKNSVNDSVYSMGRLMWAVSLSHQTENTHYWKAVTNNSDAVVMRDTNNTNSSDTTLIAGTFTLPAGDCVVLMSAESADSSGLTADGGRTTYAYIDGAARKKTGKLTWESHNDWSGWSYMEIVNFSSGSHTFQLRGGNRDGNTADVKMRRGRIIALSLNYWDDFAYSQVSADSTVTTNYPTAKNYMSVSLTPSVSQDVLVIGNTVFHRTTPTTTSDIHRITRINNTTDGIIHSWISTMNPRDDEDTTYSTSFGFASAVSSAKTFLFQTSREAAVSDLNGNGSLLALGMKEQNLSAPAATNGRKKRVHAINSYGALREEDLRPVDYAKKVLKLPDCNCEE